MDLRPLDEDFAVAPQITPEEVPAIAAAGYRVLICNRPDGEAPGQPEAAAIEDAARAAGLSFHILAIGQQGIPPGMADELNRIRDAAQAPVLAYCRSGTRSATLWAVAEAGRRDADAILAATRRAGYEFGHLRPVLARLSGRGTG